MNTSKPKLKVQTPACVLPHVIGRVYGQTITGTTFKYEVIEHKGEFHGKQYYIVRNIETEHRMLICESELHAL